MIKISRRYVNPKDFGHYVNNLWSAFTLTDNKEDIRLLFKDLFTHTEYKMFAKRLEIARRLLTNQTYQEIGNALKVTSRTINSVSNILSSSGDGLRKADAKLQALERHYQNYRNERQARLEKKSMPVMPGSKVLPDLIKMGVSAGSRAIVRSIKQRSAKKELSI